MRYDSGASFVPIRPETNEIAANNIAGSIYVFSERDTFSSFVRVGVEGLKCGPAEYNIQGPQTVYSAM